SSFTLGFTATTNGAQTGQLTLINNDANNGDGIESPFVLNLLATANIPGTPPAVNLTAPGNGAAYPFGQTITVTATATAATGSIAKVEFFVTTGVGQLLIGRLTNAPPYTINWIGADPGNYTITAAATDNAG